MNLAFIDLSVMGFPMAGHIAEAGHDVTVYNRTPAKADSWVEKYGGRAAVPPQTRPAGCRIRLRLRRQRTTMSARSRRR
jgi:3-hydroxyisobutyrate dehydrogenase-like beta-hydroxyacid dehydrogenase